MPFSPLTRFNVLTTQPKDNENGLVGRWTFDDGTATDFSGNQNHGTLVNSPASVDGIINNALKFVLATPSYINIPVSVLDINYAKTTGLTISAWAKFPITHANVTYPLCGGNNANSNLGFSSGGLTLADGTSFDQATFQVYDGAYQSAQNSSALGLSSNQWHHFAGVANPATSLLSVYVDGVFVASKAYTPSTTTLATNNAWIGSGVINNIRINASGPMDDVRVYKRALSRDEIFAMYAQGLSFQAGSPEGEMPMLNLAAVARVSTKVYEVNQAIKRAAFW